MAELSKFNECKMTLNRVTMVKKIVSCDLTLGLSNLGLKIFLVFANNSLFAISLCNFFCYDPLKIENFIFGCRYFVLVFVIFISC